MLGKDNIWKVIVKGAERGLRKTRGENGKLLPKQATSFPKGKKRPKKKMVYRTGICKSFANRKKGKGRPTNGPKT